ncbi:MAG TPA: hypothetical protein VM689_24585 [Aliidongia sp.]|nr:hypothetical protein [Aliidongia sp.]
MARLILAMAALTALAACSAPGASVERMAQEQHACAELGLAPDTPNFGSCVGNLEAMVQQNDYSGHL